MKDHKLLAKIKSHTTQVMLVIETLIIFGVFQILTEGTFLTARNLTNIMMQGCVYSIMGVGIVFVMVSGNMDLSGGSVLGMLAALGGVMQVAGSGTPITIAAMLLLGIAVGLWQGYWVSYRQLPSFIVTLAGMLMFRGFCLLIGGGGTVGPVSSSFKALGSSYLPKIFSENFPDTTLILLIAIEVAAVCMMVRSRKNSSRLGLPQESQKAFIVKLSLITVALAAVAYIFCSYQGMPCAVLLLGILAITFHYIAKNTTFGRYVFSIGGNSEATRLAGINTKKIVLQVYILMGFLVGVASIVYLGRVGQATANAGKDFEFSAITGCIVGGVSTLGGIGNIPYAILGTMLMTGLDNGMSLMNLGSTFQYIVRGLVLLLAVAIDVASKSKKS